MDFVGKEAEVSAFSSSVGIGIGFFGLPDSLSEGVGCVVLWGISVGEAAETGGCSFVAESSCEVSFRGGISEVYEQECFGRGRSCHNLPFLVYLFLMRS